jgi:hypothetical protein
MDSELEAMWKEAVEFEFEVLCWYLSVGAEQKHDKTSVCVAAIQAKIRRPDFQHTK